MIREDFQQGMESRCPSNIVLIVLTLRWSDEHSDTETESTIMSVTENYWLIYAAATTVRNMTLSCGVLFSLSQVSVTELTSN